MFIWKIPLIFDKESAPKIFRTYKEILHFNNNSPNKRILNS